MVSAVSKYLHIFVDEGRELLERLVRKLLALEEDPSDKEAMESALRIVHTIKGSAKMVGLDNISHAAHAVEGLLKGVFGAGRELPTDERLTAAEKFLTEEELDSGIVVGRGDHVRFWHLTFQEYLAARGLAALAEDEQRSILRSTLYTSEWKEVALLLAGVLYHQGIDRVDRFVTNTIDDLGRQQQESRQPRQQALKEFQLRIFGEGHPYAQPFSGSGTKESLAALTRDELAAFHETYFKPGNSAIVVVGDMDLDQAVEALCGALSLLKEAPGRVGGQLDRVVVA